MEALPVIIPGKGPDFEETGGLYGMREQTIARIRDKKVITIVRGLYGEKVVQLAEALYAGGIELMEVTFDQKNPDSHADTMAAIRAINEAMGERMCVGAGTVTSVELVEKAHAAGAKYIVSPDLQPDVIARTRELGMVSLPGAFTATEISNAYHAGADFVKVFPSAQAGPAYIKAIRGPLNHIPLLAVGGVDEKNAAAFMKAGCSGIGVGGNLVNKEWIAGGEWSKITELAREFIAAVE